tara:strand:- start:676 stop:909 length:234 start_codon:yes stop_codon:yes gene_type:complete
MKTVEKMVEHYKEMQSHNSFATISMLDEIKQQYIAMANGGDGGQLKGFDKGKTCRSHNYSGYPDNFFREVCERMGWL